jgi:hypothetical protein
LQQFIEYLNNLAKNKFYTMLNTQIPQAVAFKEATSLGANIINH